MGRGGVFRLHDSFGCGTSLHPRLYHTAVMLKRQRRVEHEMKFIPTFSRKGQDYAPSTAIGGFFQNGKSSFLF